VLLTSAFIRINGGQLEAAPGEIAEAVLFAATADPSDREKTVGVLYGWMRDHVAKGDART
jgi:hypothetical protein